MEESSQSDDQRRSQRGQQEIGVQLRAARQARRVSQSSLARRTRIPQSAISRIEMGREVPSVDRYRRLLAGLGLTVDLELGPLRAYRGDFRHMGAAKRLSPSERLEQAAAWQSFAAEIRGKAASESR